MDAFPNAVMYVSLVALAADPSLWRYNPSDDTMLFGADALLGSPSGEIWDVLRSSADGHVRSLTEHLIQWISKTPQSFETLDEFITAAATAQPVRRGPNTWPTTTAREAAEPPRTWGNPPPAGQPATVPAPVQQWGKPATGAGPALPNAVPPPPPPPEENSFASVLIVIIVIIAIVAFLSKL
jgi:hypothetical protein